MKDESSPTIYRTRGRRIALFLPLHLVGLVTVPEAEGSGEVAAQELLLLDAAEDGLVDGLLVSGTGGGNLLLLLRKKCTLVLNVQTRKPVKLSSGGEKRTSGFSPCLKKASSDFFSAFFSLVK